MFWYEVDDDFVIVTVSFVFGRFFSFFRRFGTKWMRRRRISLTEDERTPKEWHGKLVQTEGISLKDDEKKKGRRKREGKREEEREGRKQN